MERARLLEVANAERARAEAARQRASLLADVGAVLTAAWGPAERMQRLLGTLVPAFADMASVEALHGDHLELLAAAHADPASLPALEHERRSVPDARSDGSSAAPSCTAGPNWSRSPAAPDPARPARRAACCATSALAVPLRARGKVIGGLLLQQSQSGRRFDEADLALAELIAGRAALALDNAALYQQQVEAVTALQHVLLPGSLPRIEGVAATARYRPGTAALDVGGDWYDVITLPEHRVGIVLGDVVGRGVTAAATMGQLRSAVAAIAPYSAGPVEVLERLDRFAGTIPRATLATVAYADYEPATGALRYACAGHLPPLLITDRQVRFLDAGRGVPLATGSDVGWTQAQVQIRREGTLICYSDGLVERRGVDLDDRLRELAAVATDLAGNPLTRLCERLLDRMIGHQPLGDDVALLCVELQRVPAARFHQIVPAHSSQLAPLRAELRSWGAAAGLLQPGLGDLLLAVGEACANAVEHAYLGDRPVGDIEVSVEIDANGTVARVSDTGRWRDQPHGLPNRGRGLALVRATMPEVHVESWSSGTTVTMRRPGAYPSSVRRGVAALSGRSRFIRSPAGHPSLMARPAGLPRSGETVHGGGYGGLTVVPASGGEMLWARQVHAGAYALQPRRCLRWGQLARHAGPRRAAGAAATASPTPRAPPRWRRPSSGCARRSTGCTRRCAAGRRSSRPRAC